MIIETKPTLYRPVVAQVCTPHEQGESTPLGGRLEWEPLAGSVDWTLANDCDECIVRMRYAEYTETIQRSDNPDYDGRVDYRRTHKGREFDSTVCHVQVGSGDHIATIKDADGKITERVVPEKDVITTVRLFLSAQYLRRGFDVRIAEFEQLGADLVQDAAYLYIRPVRV